MRVALVCSEFRPGASLDVGVHARGLATALACSGVEVEVFTLAHSPGAPLTARRQEVSVPEAEGSLAVTSVAVGEREDPGAIAQAFGRFLDRVRPRLCHFESIEALGTGVIEEADRRGLPSVYCARNAWPAHDELTLTLPDLAPFELGDREAEVRGWAARALCPSLPEGGGSPSDPEERALLRQLLEDDLDELAARPEIGPALSAARARVEEARSAKRAALSLVDGRFASSRLLARQLSATVGRAFTPRLPGCEPSAERLEPGAAHPSRTRVVFLGTSRPIDGLGVLLDALRELVADPGREAPDLRVHLEPTDPDRDADARSRAEALGAVFECGRGPLDPLRALGAADALVYPSLRGRFAPAPVRLAQASGLPVLASSLPGIDEFVSAEASILVEPGAVDALAGALESVALRTQAFDGLREAALHRAVSEAGKGPLKGLAEEAAEWSETYQQLVRARGATTESSGPPHAAEFAATHAALDHESLGELFTRVQAGLEQLRSAFGLPDTTASLMARAVARGGPLGDATGDGRTHGEEAPLGSLESVGEAIQSLDRDLLPRPDAGRPAAAAPGSADAGDGRRELVGDGEALA